MICKCTKKQVQLYLLAAIILLSGLGSAVFIYPTSDYNSGNVLGYGVENGSMYEITPENTKMYSRNLALYGGEANVLVDEFKNWIMGLLHGKSLAYAIACSTVCISFGILVVADYLPQKAQEPDAQDKNSENK